MAHRNLIGGTSYDTKGGRCLVDGTGYAIKKGRTLIDGTGYDVEFGGVSAVLAENTPDVIQAVAQSGQAANYWAVGDMVPITLNGTVGALTFSNETYYAFIIGFDHNSGVEGSNTIHFQFGKTSAGVDIAFVDASYGTSRTQGTFRMNNSSSTNTGGWESSYMRSTICQAFLNALPTEWQNIVAPCTKYSSTGGGNSDSNIGVTSDKIWLLAEFEVLGTRATANTYEKNYQKQYEYYANGNSKIKYKHSSTASPAIWYLRSAVSSDTKSWCCIAADGTDSSATALYSRGFAPGFMVA